MGTVSDGMFHLCSKLCNVVIPEGITAIGFGFFSGCNSLASVELPESVKTIGSSAYSSCFGLVDITIRSSVQVIEDYAFSSCLNLTDVTILNPSCAIYGDVSTFNNDYNASGDGRFTGTIHGYSGSTAETYANQYHITFVSLDSVDHDINQDGTVDTLDLVMLQKYLIRDLDFTRNQSEKADINGDGRVNGMDLALLRQILIK